MALAHASLALVHIWGGTRRFWERWPGWGALGCISAAAACRSSSHVNPFWAVCYSAAFFFRCVFFRCVFVRCVFFSCFFLPLRVLQLRVRAVFLHMSPYLTGCRILAGTRAGVVRRSSRMRSDGIRQETPLASPLLTLIMRSDGIRQEKKKTPLPPLSLP